MQIRKAVWLLLALLFSLAFSAFTIASLTICAIDIVRTYRAAAWPTAPATILSTAVDHGCAKGKSYSLDLRYEYEHAGHRYPGHGIQFGLSPCVSEAEALALAHAYPMGEQILVHVNPADPAESTIRVGAPTRDDWIGVAGSCAMLVFALLFLGRVISGWKQERLLQS